MPTLERDEDLAGFVAEKAREHRVPGVAAGVLHDGHAYAATHGVTSTADPLEVDADTLFLIGSTTKTLTATALMRLVEEGTLALADRVVEHLPDFTVADPDAARSVTLLQLLNHTAGWRGDALPATGFGDDALARAMPVVAEGPQEFPPGRYTSYNNAALMVAGWVLEVVTGRSYEQAVTDLVLGPLELASTFFLPWEVATRRLAVGHVLRPDTEHPLHAWPMSRAMNPAGGAICSLRDQLAYAAFHLSGQTHGSAPITEPTRLLMQQPTAEMRSTLTGVGISWLLSDHGGVRLLSHGGNVSNLYTSAFHLAPDHGLALVVMGNSGGATALGSELLDWCMQHYLHQPARAPLPALPLTGELIGEYVGTYDVGPWTFAVTSADDKLFVQMVLPDGSPEELQALFAKPPIEMVLVGTDQLALAANPVQPVADYIRDEHGDVAWFRHGMRMARCTDGDT